MVDAVLDRIVNANIGFTDKGKGSVMRIMVEAILAELDIAYYTLYMHYTSMMVDDAEGDDLDRVISILGVVRNPATPCSGVIRFSRSTPAQTDIPIPYDLVVSTKPSASDELTEFTVTDTGAVLAAGQTYIDVNVRAVVAGKIYISPGRINTMNTPVVGIESISNTIAFDGGVDIETDISLRQRAKIALAGLGKATDSAIESAIRKIDGVIDVMVMDQARGVGTSDVIVVGSVIPLPQATADLVDSAVRANKASGINVQVVYPTVRTVDVTVTTTVGADLAGGAIVKYFGTLGIADTFMVRQMEHTVLDVTGNPLDDITTSIPSANVVASSTEIIRRGVITINGVVWNG
jgi:uncharacterized phage protein gp47/JayE